MPKQFTAVKEKTKKVYQTLACKHPTGQKMTRKCVGKRAGDGLDPVLKFSEDTKISSREAALDGELEWQMKSDRKGEKSAR